MFVLNAEEAAVSEAVAAFASERLAPQAIAWDQTKHFPVDVLREAAAMGLGGVCIGDDVGGSQMRRLDSVRIFEELSAGDPSVSAYLSIHNMAAGMIDRYGNDDQRRRWLPDLCSMARLASYCLTEPGNGSDAAALSTTAVRDGEDYLLSGVKQFISGAGEADVYLVMARTGEPGARGISTFVLEKGTPGLSFGANERKMGWNAQPTRQVIMESVRVPADQRLAAEGKGFGIAMNGLNGGRLNIAACSLGGARTAWQTAVRHLADREAFGEPLITNPALQFRLADMRTRLETARSILWRAADALDRGAEDAVELCAMAKLVCTDNGFEVANDALQLLGGYGYLSEYGVEKFVRDLRVHQILEGTNEIMRLVIARTMLPA